MISFTERDGIGVLTLDRPPVNAIDTALLDELVSLRDRIDRDPGIRVVIVRGQRRFFCPGVDIKMISGFLREPDGAQVMLGFAERLQGFYAQWESLKIPTIAALEGTATGGGLEFALACDLRIASHDIRVGLPEVKIGLLPAAGGTQRLTRIAGTATATRMILTGELVSGTDAERLGIVHKAVPANEVDAEAHAWAEALTGFAPSSLTEIKRCLSLAPSPSGFTAEIEASARLFAAPDSQRLVHAFLSRRSNGQTRAASS